MSFKINISYTEDSEEHGIMKLLKPILSGAKIRKGGASKPYKHTYITSKKDETALSKKLIDIPP